jgi:hypothetical protein
MPTHAQLPDAGIISHHDIDAQLPTIEEKRDLQDLVSGVLELGVSTANTSIPPTDAEAPLARRLPSAPDSSPSWTTMVPAPTCTWSSATAPAGGMWR